jgi:N,N'-diacetylchitobiose phosphorylase
MGRDHSAHGRARHPWLTGSAGWAYHAVTHWIQGVRPGYSELTIDPCIPAEWKEFEVTREWRGATFHILVKNPSGVEKGVKAISLNGEPLEGAIPLQKAGSYNEIVVTMGA